MADDELRAVYCEGMAGAFQNAFDKAGTGSAERRQRQIGRSCFQWSTSSPRKARFVALKGLELSTKQPATAGQIGVNPLFDGLDFRRKRSVCAGYVKADQLARPG